MFKLWYEAKEEYVLIKCSESNYIHGFDEEPSMESKEDDRAPSL